MVNRIVTGAHYGLRDWLLQRITAIVMAFFTLLVAVVLLTHQPLHFDEWQSLFHNQWVRFASLLFLLSLFLHAWVGIRDIAMDYLHHAGFRLAVEVLTILVLIIYAAWSVQILWGLQ